MQSGDAYFIGRIIGSSGFSNGTFCRWWIAAGDQWKLVNGFEKGQTQTDSPKDSNEIAIWSHPLDLFYEFYSIQGWPKITFEVWEHDSLGRSFLGGYGFCTLPTSPGEHILSVQLWKPVGTILEDLASSFVGGSPHLRNQDLVHRPNDRFRMKSETAGTVNMQISLILGRVSQFQVDF